VVASRQAVLEVTPVGETILRITEVNGERDADLLEICEASGSLGTLFGAGECGQQQSGQDGNDGDDDEQLDQGEATLPAPWDSFQTCRGALHDKRLIQAIRTDRPSRDFRNHGVPLDNSQVFGHDARDDYAN
jgi:hypothetical protein